MNIVIVGGGVIGMMQARELAQKGHSVTLVEKQLAGSEASWAGGGIISPLYPWRYSKAVTTLATWAQSYYPYLIQDLEAESGIDPELTRHGLLVLDIEDRDRAIAWSSEMGYSWVEEITHKKLYELEPNLRPGLQSALYMPHLGSIRNPRLLRSLGTVLANERKVTMIENDPVESFALSGGRVTGVVTMSGRTVSGDKVIICSGAWTSELLQRLDLEGLELNIEPVKGQMLLFDAPKGLVNRVVLNGGKYVIPRRDGQVLAGSTLEYCGFDKQLDDVAKQALSDIAIDMFPDLAKCVISHQWAGLRPGSPNGIPTISEVPQVEGLFVNAGHFRNGLVLAPASVRLMTTLICDEPAPFDPSPYAISA